MPAARALAHSARLYALVPCAGVGERAGTHGPKQYAPIAGQSMVAHTVAALAGVARLTATLVVLNAQDHDFERHVPGFTGWAARCGGASRAQSVANGLAALQARGADDDDWVLVHDAARCLLRAEWVDALIDACLDDAVGGLLALPVADTLKQAAGDRVATTVERTGKWMAQTPQMFRLQTLRRALVLAGSAVTDESSAIEALGLSPRLVRGDPRNLKVTWSQDFEWAEHLIRLASAPTAAVSVSSTLSASSFPSASSASG